MAGKKKSIDFTETRFEANSPVVQERMRSGYNSMYGVNVVRITFRNVSEKKILGLSILIWPKDKAGENITREPVEYNYYGLEIPDGRNFGSTEDIVIEEAEQYAVVVTRAEYDDGTFFRGEVLLRKMPDPLPVDTMGSFEEDFRKVVTEKKPKIKIECAPEKKDIFWRCVCGRIYPKDNTSCPACRLDRDWITGVYSELREEKRRQEAEAKAAARAKREEEARLAAEEEARRKEELRLEAEQLAEERRKAEEQRKKAEEEERLSQEAERLREEELRKQRLKRYKILGTCCAAAIGCFVLILCVWLVPIQKGEVAEEPLSVEPEVITQKEYVYVEKPEEPEPVSYGQSIAIMGEDLDENDRRLVLRLIGIQEEDFEHFIVVPVTNAQEHEYLDATIGAEKIGSSSRSCLLITPTAPGSGITISMYNINYCTEEMYREALATAGIEDAEVIIAAPKESSGTSALTGIYLAPQYMEQPQAQTQE